MRLRVPDGAVIPLVLAALVLVFMLPFLRPPTGNEVLDGHDLVNQQYPLYSLIFDSVRSGAGLPLWNPYQFAGQSIASNPQSTIFYPPAWMMLPLGVPRGVGWLVILHLWLGGWGMAQFMRQLGATRGGALAGGIVYTFSGVIAAHLNAGHLNYLMCSAWLPWIAGAYLWGVGRRDWLAGALPGGAALGLCILSGHPPMLYFGVVWLVVMAVYAVAARQAKPLQALRTLAAILISGGVLGAALLLPVADFTLRSTRTSGASLGFSNSYALPVGQVLTLLFPNLFGEPNNGYWGVPFYEELTVYVGTLPLAALFLVRRRPATLLLAAFVIVGLIVSLGIEGGLFSLLYYLLPGYSLFRVPSRALYFVTVGAAGLAALLVSDLQNTSPVERSMLLRRVLWILPVLALLCLGLAFIVMAAFNIDRTDDTTHWRTYHTATVAMMTALALGGAWLGLRLWTMKGVDSRLALALMIAVMSLDVWRIAAPLVTVSAVDVPPIWQVIARAFPASSDARVMTIPNDITWQAGAAYTRHLNIGGYDPLVSGDYQLLLDASGYDPLSPVARLLGVNAVISNQPYEGASVPDTEALTLAAQEGDWRVYRLAEQRPRAFMAYQVDVIEDDETARRRLASGEVDFTETAVVDRPVNCDIGGSGAAAEVIFTQDGPNTVELAVTTGQPGILILADSYDPNWTVTVDGAPAEMLRVYTALRGVCLPAGEHVVRFEYQPRTFYAGVILSVLGWTAWGALGLARLRRVRYD